MGEAAFSYWTDPDTTYSMGWLLIVAAFYAVIKIADLTR